MLHPTFSTYLNKSIFNNVLFHLNLLWEIADLDSYYPETFLLQARTNRVQVIHAADLAISAFILVMKAFP